MAEDRDSLLERYFDGDLPQQQRRQLEADPEARSRIALQRQIDAGLRDIFSAGVPDAGSIPIESARRARGDLSWARLALYAAVIVILAGAGFWFRHSISQRNTFNPMRSPERIYDRLVRAGFEPEFVCEPGPEFVAAVADRFGEGLDIEPAAGVRVIGWAYDSDRPAAGSAYTGTILSEDMLILMAYVQEQPVIVLMDRLEADDRPRLAPGSDLHQFRRRLDDFVLYEVTPLGRARLLRDFTAP
ncbi:MAG: anti-sigma factor family protein [Phycisphaerales bacterium JB039]